MKNRLEKIQEKLYDENIFLYILDAMAYRGDLIGCTVRSDNRGEVSVVFSLNGKQITQEQILIDNPEKKPLYPYIGMAHKGIRVLAKVLATFCCHSSSTVVLFFSSFTSPIFHIPNVCLYSSKQEAIPRSVQLPY